MPLGESAVQKKGGVDTVFHRNLQALKFQN